MRYSQSEKMETIRLVEESDRPVKETLCELDLSRSTFYEWYRRYRESGYDGLANRRSSPRRFWNRIPESEKQKVVDLAISEPEKTPRELAFNITDKEGWFISESSVYRILKAYDLITSPAYIVLSAADKFKHPTTRVNELWQTDFTYFKVCGWGWYYLGSVLDDYSRYIISWKLFASMSTEDVKEVLDLAIEKSGVDKVHVRHRPRLLSDNGPCYISQELKKYMHEKEMKHIRGQPYHPMTQGKIERYHRSMKNVVKLQNYYLPWELEAEIAKFIDYYNNERYHEAINNIIPVDMYYGRAQKILTQRDIIKRQTMQNRRRYNLETESKKKVLELA
jgi:transposase InsO family protein